MLLANARLKHQPFASIQGPGAWSRRDIEDMLFLGVLGVIAGGRLGYCLFYKPGYYAHHPAGDLLRLAGRHELPRRHARRHRLADGFARSRGKPFWQVMDFVAPCVPPGLAGPRGQLHQRRAVGPRRRPVAALGDGVPAKRHAIPRHPSQVYQFLLEGVLLFILLWLYARKQRKEAQVSAVFLVGYGVFRFTAEFFREPDAHLGMLSRLDEHGPVAVRPHDPRRRAAVGLGRDARRGGWPTRAAGALSARQLVRRR
jgi:phosphatidylglycerol:prolipoprotein diacylglycerol transferase